MGERFPLQLCIWESPAYKDEEVMGMNEITKGVPGDVEETRPRTELGILQL